MADRFRWLHPKHILRDLLALDDRPHAIALGTTIGMFLGLTPTVGVQMILVMVLAFCTSRVLYFNRTAAILAVYVTNPLTLIPIYWFNYCVGTAVLQAPSHSRGDLAAVLRYEGVSEWLATVQTLLHQFGWPLLVGSLIVATIVSAVTYPTVLWAVRRVRVAAALDADGEATPQARDDESRRDNTSAA